MTRQAELPPFLASRLEALRQAEVRTRFQALIYEAADDRLLSTLKRDSPSDQPETANEYRDRRNAIWMIKGVSPTEARGTWSRTRMQGLRNAWASTAGELVAVLQRQAAYVLSFQKRYRTRGE